MKDNVRTAKAKIIGLFMMLVGTVVLVIIDQATKIIAQNQLANDKVVSVIPRVLHLNYLENRGAAFGILQNSRTFFLVITLIVSCVAFFIAWKLLGNMKFNLLILNLILFLAGAIGNFIDRLARHYVIDFFEFSFIEFPVFNVADIYVTISFVLFIILLFFVYKEKDFEGIFSKYNKKGAVEESDK